jgi:hypothetical protein
VRFGVYSYTAEDPAVCPDVTGVAPALDAAADIGGYLAALELPVLKGETPTGAALTKVTASLADVSGRRTVVLLTDGDPNTCDRFDPQCGHDEAYRVAQEAHEAGTTTLVVGIDRDELTLTPIYLQGLANAGAGQPVTELDASHLAQCHTLGVDPVAAYAPTGGNAPFRRPSAENLGAVLTAIVESTLGE